MSFLIIFSIFTLPFKKMPILLTNGIRQKYNHSRLIKVHIPYLVDHVEHLQLIVIARRARAKITVLLLNLHHLLLLILEQLGQSSLRFRLGNVSFPLNHTEWHNLIRISTPLSMAIILRVLIHLQCDNYQPILI